ncbi:hypothetical protein Hypma_009155 [Hypsizygus marmoreus]|uniref:Uncharacterized protein n=1 Tax=Hypsizygus marmoreus TaxID=39966 RepID=A0A369JQS1_HYPMA|nr:hypothetical protein Hypma_009155 [Hypsizygus marmoreus]
MDEQNSRHWFCYSQHEGPGQTTMGTGCMVSVVLDGAARHHFSGIRLIIVYKESEALNDVKKLTDCLRASKFGVIQTGDRYPTYRELLRRRSASIQRTRSLSQAASTSALSLPLCNVVFELVDANDDLSYAVALTLRLDLATTDADIAPFRIIYDRIHPCNNTLSHSSILAFLECSHPFDPTDRGAFEFFFYRRKACGIHAHSVRVLPVIDTERAPCPPLPPHVVSMIVTLAIGNDVRQQLGWRTSLLAYGLVCNGWVHVLDLFFSWLPKQHDADAIKVARSLERRPERAALMYSFSFWYYRAPEGEEEDKEMWKSLMTILRLGTNVTDVKLCLVHESVVRELVQRLADLREVRACQVSPTYDEGLGVGRRHLVCGISRRLSRGGSNFPPLRCKIEDLRLERGLITGTQLLQFALPIVKCVHLEHIDGVSNADFLTFLMLLAPTLTSLTVQNCEFARGEGKEETGAEVRAETAEETETTEATEEHAVDTAMPYLTSLTQLSIDGKAGSALAIMRKPPLASRSPSPGPPALNVSRILITDARGMSLASVLRAAERTHWDMVRVVWYGGVTDYDMVEVAEVAAEVLERGVTLSCHNFGD